MANLIRLVFVLLASGFLFGCVTSTEMKPLATHLYVGDHALSGVRRAQAGEALLCSEQRFDDMICMPSADFTELAERIRYLQNIEAKK